MVIAELSKYGYLAAEEVSSTNRDRETERQGDREPERQRDRETERQGARERQRDRETERQRDRETERQAGRQAGRQTESGSLCIKRLRDDWRITESDRPEWE